MPKIQCSQCKAMNQDVTVDDPCWQCGTVLSGPRSAIDTGDGAPTSEADSASRTGSVSPAIQKQIERTRPQDKIPLAQRHKPVGPNVAAIAVSATILAIIVIAILLYLKVLHL